MVPSNQEAVKIFRMVGSGQAQASESRQQAVGCLASPMFTDLRRRRLTLKTFLAQSERPAAERVRSPRSFVLRLDERFAKHPSDRRQAICTRDETGRKAPILAHRRWPGWPRSVVRLAAML